MNYLPCSITFDPLIYIYTLFYISKLACVSFFSSRVSPGLSGRRAFVVKNVWSQVSSLICSNYLLWICLC